MAKFPVDPSLVDVIRAFERIGFVMVREGNHIAMARTELDGRRTPLTLPNHRHVKGSTLRMALTQTGVSRDEFLEAFNQ